MIIFYLWASESPNKRKVVGVQFYNHKK